VGVDVYTWRFSRYLEGEYIRILRNRSVGFQNHRIVFRRDKRGIWRKR